MHNGWSREHSGVLVAQKVPLAQFQTTPGPAYGTLTSWGFCEMKEGVLMLLEQAGAASGNSRGKRPPKIMKARGRGNGL